MARAKSYDLNYQGNGATRTRRGATQRGTGAQKKCFVWNPDGTVYCIGWSYGDDPECYCRVYPQASAIKGLLGGTTVVYNQDGIPISVITTEEGDVLVEIPEDITTDVPVIGPISPAVLEEGGGVMIKDPNTGDLTVAPVSKNGNTIKIMGREIPIWQVAVGGLVLARVLRIV